MTENEYYAILKSVRESYEVISGKIFRKGTSTELTDNELKGEILEKYHLTPKWIKELIEGLYYFSTDGWWPQPYIYEKAKKIEGGPLPFPLDRKQLLIINRLVYHPDDEVIFITTGIGGSGKSTFLNIIRQLHNNDVSNTSLSDLANEFTVAEAVKHRLIASDELAKGELNLPIVKQLASKQMMMVNPKGKTAYNVRSQSNLFFCCNKAPKIDVTDTGILRRIIYYERNTKISNPDTSLNHREYTKDELMNILNAAWRLEGALTVSWRSFFEEETHKYLMKGNSVAMTIDIPYYDDYVNACKSKGIKAYSEPNWSEIRELFLEWKKKDLEELF